MKSGAEIIMSCSIIFFDKGGRIFMRAVKYL